MLQHKLITDFTEHYMEKLFYFCLKRTGNKEEAENLTQDIALPYMKEEVDLLQKATLLEQQGDKYITNFFILSKECRLDIYNTLRRGSKERSRLLAELLTDVLPDIRSLGIAGEAIDNNSVLWWLVPYSIDYFILQAAKSSKERSCEPPQRANGEEWGFVGYEHVELPENICISQDGCGNGKCNFVQYHYSDYSLWNRCINPSTEKALLLGSCITENRNLSSFSTHESEIWSNISEKIAHSNEKGAIIPDILVITGETSAKIKDIIEEHKSYASLLQLFQNAYEELKTIFKGYNHKILHEYLGYNIVMELYQTRMMSVHDLVETGFLNVPENPATSTLGMYLWLQ